MLNANCISNKPDDLLARCSQFPVFPKCFAVTESHLNPMSIFSLFNDLNYVTFRKDRPVYNGKAAGGALLAFSAELCPVLIGSFHEDLIEIVVCRITVNAKNVVIACVYKSPNANDDSSINACEFLFSFHNEPLIILGDFNLPDFDWNYQSVYSKDHYLIFSEFFCNLNLKQFVDKPTRGNNILDLILSNVNDFVEDVQVHPPLSHCDHSIVTFNVNIAYSLQSSSNSIYNIFDFFKTDFISFNEYIDSFEWPRIFVSCSSDVMYARLLCALYNGFVQFVPRREKRDVHRKPKPPWFGNHLRTLLNRRNRMYRLKHLSEADLARFFDSDAISRHDLAFSKASFEKNLVESNEARKLFAYTGSKLSNGAMIPPIMLNGDAACESDSDKCELFRSTFSRNYATSHPVKPPQPLPVRDCLQSVHFSEYVVLGQLVKLANKLGAGPDLIPQLVLKQLAPSLSAPLAIVFNQTMEEGAVPLIWSKATVIPIYKRSGDKQSPDNFRPVSLTCIACKVQERLIRNVIMEYLVRNKLIPANQYGFVPKRSCELQLLTVLKNWLEAVDAGDSVDVIYLDLSKAFDTVPTKSLLSKLLELNICGQLYNWLKAFLSDRSFRVQVGACHSKWSAVTSGVPQGSVLGPLLFIAYLIGISSVISCSRDVYFADDTKLYRVATSFHDCYKLQSDLDAINDWFASHGLHLNSKKCCVLRLGKHRVPFKYHLGSCELPVVSFVRDLGLVVDEELNFKQHCAQLVAKCNRLSGCIIRSFKDASIRLRAFKAYVLPLLDYASSCYSPFLVSSIKSIERVQKSFLCKLAGVRHADYDDLLKEFQLGSLVSRRFMKDILLTFKIVRNLLDVDATDLFTFSSSRYATSHRLKAVDFHINCYKYFFSRRIVKFWNKLPNDIIFESSLPSFKTYLLDVSPTNEDLKAAVKRPPPYC